MSEFERPYDNDEIVREVAKAFALFGEYTAEFWEQERLDWEASQLNGGVAENLQAVPMQDAGEDVVPAPSAEPTKEKQPTIRLDGTVAAEPNYHITLRGTPRIIFPLQVEETTHTVYSTGKRAEAIKALELQPGELVHVSAVKHQWQDQGEQSERYYAWGIRRITE